MAPISEETIDFTVAFWEEKLERPVSREEAREMVQNMLDLYDVLSHWGENRMESDPISNEADDDSGIETRQA